MGTGGKRELLRETSTVRDQNMSEKWVPEEKRELLRETSTVCD